MNLHRALVEILLILTGTIFRPYWHMHVETISMIKTGSPGASGYAPGQEMQAKGSKKGEPVKPAVRTPVE
jgi:hypothetical protein